MHSNLNDTIPNLYARAPLPIFMLELLPTPLQKKSPTPFNTYLDIKLVQFQIS